MRLALLGSHAVLVLFLFLVPASTFGQDTDAALAKDPVLFLKTAREALKWDEPAAPVKIVGPLYFVGTQGLASYLITTSEGHILINTGMPGSGPMIEESIRKLKLKPEDIRVLLAGHAHADHVGGHAYLQKLSRAKVAMMAEEVDLIQSGGKADFQYGSYPEFTFEPVKVDQVLHDSGRFKVGNITVTPRLTPGHTKGSTTFIIEVMEGGKVYNIVLPSSTSINPGYRLVKDPSYPGIADDYRRTFQVLETLKPDIWLDAHTEVCDFWGRRERAGTESFAAWVDPDGYRKWLADARQKFDATIAAETGAPAVPAVKASDQ